MTDGRGNTADGSVSDRLTPQVQHPGDIQDVARAFAWTVRNIAKYGGNPEQIFVSGRSAGGHLAALLATSEQYLAAEKLTPRAIKGVIPISGVYLFGEGWMLEAVIGKGPEAIASASPLKHVTGREPPFSILYADKDFPTCDAMSRALAEALQAKNVEARVVEVPDRTHISIIVKMALGEADPVSQETLKFIAEHAGMTLTPRKERVEPGKDAAGG